MQTQHEPRSVRFTRARLAETRHVPPNPWRGLYAIYPFTAGGETAEPFPPLQPGHSLCLVEINLQRFRSDAISDAALEEIQRIFGYFEDHRQEMIVRFLYDWDGNGLQSEPQELPVIFRHMGQLSPLLRGFQNRIYTLQGLFVGSWGEMHGSRHLGAKSMAALTHALDEAAGGKTLLSVRCPNQWREIMQTYDPPPVEHLFDGTLRARLGLFNDGILASETDYGTYGETSRAQAPHYGVKLNREEELAFQNLLCAGTPNGGELVYGEGGFTLREIYRAFRLMRLSYLNADFDKQAFDNLRSQKNIARGRAWRGADACEYLTAHLGYRYCVRKALVKPAQGGADVQVQVENTGFACCYFPLEASLYLRTHARDTLLSVPIPCDTRRWQPGDAAWLTARISATGVPKGDYRLELGLTDPRSGKPVYLATAARGEDIRQTLLLGTLRVRL